MEENKNNKCSSKKHGEIEAIYYCIECRIYMCNKCESFHSDLFSNHSPYNLNKSSVDILNSICKENNHTDLLNYYCKNHNQLVCVKCISKIKGKGNGMHNDCNISFIEDIKEEKKKNLSKNILYLEELSKGLEESINNLNPIFEKINVNKENLEKKIQIIFTKLRNALNEREDELLSDVEKMFDELYFNGNEYNEFKKLPKKVKISLEKGKKIDNEWDDENKLIYLINDCINIENNINNIKILNEKKEKFRDLNIEIKLSHEEDKIDNYIKRIKSFGYVYHNRKDGYKLLKRPINAHEENTVLLLTDNVSPILKNLLNFNNSVNKLDIQSSNILPNMKFHNMHKYKAVVYDLRDAGFNVESNFEEISKYLKNGGNIIITHDQWTWAQSKGRANAKLLGAKILSQSYAIVKKAKIYNNNHPIFTSFYNLYKENQNIIAISATHKLIQFLKIWKTIIKTF